jgi:hypothetical protein
MARTSKLPSLAATHQGFVVAMRATVTTSKRPPWCEWIIVSRWGSLGEHLSVGRTKTAALAGMSAPIELAPCQTALAGLLRLPPISEASTFLFAQLLPASLSVAGDFTPLEGYVQLRGGGGRLRLLAEGRYVARALRTAWRVEAVQAAWIGEFVEGGSNQTT